MITLTEDVKRAAEEHAAREAPEKGERRESCGLVVIIEGVQTYVPCQNVAEKKIEHFRVCPKDYAAADDAGEIVAVVHSHPYAAPVPSQPDLVACEASALPWFIVNVPKNIWFGFEPSGYTAPLKGREFCHGVLDCYALVRDFYDRELKIDLPNYSRHGRWWQDGGNLYMDNLDHAGFDIVDGPPERGDMILMQIQSNVANHAGIYLGDGRILHHRFGRLSTEDVYGGYYQKHTIAVCRHRQTAVADGHPARGAGS